jgi:ubiquinone/menaquinone biosynthesis C-methylase UbiE
MTLLLALALALAGSEPHKGQGQGKEGPNDKFLKPDLDVSAWVERFEKPGREVYDKRRQIVAAAKLKKGAAVADVGAGTGLFTMLFAEAVGPTGKVYAIEISPKFIEHLGRRATKSGATQVQVVRGSATSIELPAASVDLVFLCDTYHHFEQPKPTLASIRKALRPGGELLLVDFEREPGKTAAWIIEHVRAGKAVMTKEIEAAGFVKVEEPPILKENYLIRFRLRR